MKYLALATDYDGTLAHDGRVSEATIAALTRLRDSGRRLILVTGRVLPELRETFPWLNIFDLVVVENGALLYDPATKVETVLAEPAPQDFVNRLMSGGVGPISSGRVIVATWEPHEKTVLQTIHEMGLEMQVVFNKGAVMVLPSGINKATGLAAALEKLGITPSQCVGIGDAENDHAFLSVCGVSVAVANALAAVKGRADIVTAGDHGEGVIQVIDQLLTDDFASVEIRPRGD